MFHRTPFFLPLFYPGLVWRMPAERNEIYLTFDDGPVPEPTGFVLHTLSVFRVKATFFCIGDNVRKHPGVFHRIINDGHAIGNHTFSHLNGWKTPASLYRQNVERFDEQLAQTNATLPCRLFRPPYGRITRKQIKALAAYKIVMWDVLTYDYSNTITPESCLRNSIRAVRNGSIVVFHDSIKARKNMMFALPRFIEDCLEKGYTFNLLA